MAARDGDRDIDNAIQYEITAGAVDIFGINQQDGTVYSKVSSTRVCNTR